VEVERSVAAWTRCERERIDVKNLPKQKVHVITMGCAKNVVDSEKLMAQLRLSNIELTPSIDEADIAVINTCGFIEAAKRESIDVIMENVRRKADGRLRRVYAMGCLTERYRHELATELPDVDGIFGSNSLPEVLSTLGADYKRELLGERLLTTPTHFAYLKISEGCDNPCSFCAIPIMRGKHAGRTMEDILGEATLLAQRGVKELIIIGQDTTYYGLDTYGERRLAELLQRLGDVGGIEWVRLMYAYPAKFPRDVLAVIADHPHLCKYLDLPVQHASDSVLRSMRRGITRRATLELIDAIRQRIPDIALRTTLIVGYPNETEQEFEELVEFIQEVKFDRLGVFTYSPEDGTTAFELGDPIPQEEKEHRQSVIMEVQRDISLEKNSRLVGTRQRVLVDRKEDSVWIGRTQRDAPEIDNEVRVTSDRPLRVGDFYEVDILDASEYDIAGRTLARASTGLSA
jgi:ribosomal protein S12 methylthiotransferase